jgi:alpha-1,2-mannosyltransferase
MQLTSTLTRAPTTPYSIQPISAFYCFLIANWIAAAYAPIQDCDETFNYWEPTHYLSHGYGKQTWEYSPEYAIRSWAYIGIHAIVGNLRRLLPRSNKVRLVPTNEPERWPRGQ